VSTSAWPESIPYLPNSVFQPNFDLVEAVVRTIQEAGLAVTVTHVKGHKDDDTPYTELPFPAQLNVDAVKHAGIYQRRHGSFLPWISLSPTRPVALDIDGQTIHRHFKSSIRDAAHYQPLVDRMIKSYDWLQHTPDTIDWDAHCLSTSIHRTRQTHFVRLCHGYLPAGKIAHCNNPRYPHQCPLCQQL
jgi:hypothetical protein